MKRLTITAALLAALAVSTGCASPSEAYVRAEAAAWAQYDKDDTLEKWITGALERKEITPERADALRQLNVGRRARVSHALAATQGEVTSK